MERWRGGTTLQLPPSLLSLPPHPFIPSPIHPAAAVLCPSLSLSHFVIESFSLSLSLFLYLSHRHKDGWRRSWNGAHNRLCHKVSSLSCIRPSAAFFFLAPARILTRLESVCVWRGVWAAQYGNRCFCSAKSLKGALGGGLSGVRAQSHFSLLFLSLCLSISVSPSPQLCLPWRLSKRKCEGNGMMEYVSGARGFGLFCERLH